MSTQNTLSFHPVTRDEYNEIAQALSAKGFHLNGDQGEIKALGADVQYSFAEPELTLVVKSAPVFHSMDSFCAQITQAITAYTAYLKS